MGKGRPLVSVVIVGGGASGIVLAAHLLRREDCRFRVTIVERGEHIGEGVAYSTNLPEHLLNVSAQGMSALADDRAHFERWLSAFGNDRTRPGTYVARSVYGAYLADLLNGLHDLEDGKRFATIEGEAVLLKETANGVEVQLANGASIVGHIGILATGHDLRASGLSASDGIAAGGDEQHVILGSGLTMVDQFLKLERVGFNPPVVAVSRHGLLPHPHNEALPLPLDVADIPLGTGLAFLVRWFRNLVADFERDGADWRSVVDGMRPHAQRIWRSWPAVTKRRFLRHLKPWWSIHRHRMAPAIHQRIMDAIASGRLELVAGTAQVGSSLDAARTVMIRERSTGRRRTLTVDSVHDCTGLHFDIGESENPLLRALLDSGAVRPDALAIGLDVDANCAVLGADDKASQRLFAVGPVTRGAFFEIESIPEIRQQCASLAALLAQRQAG